MRILKSRAFSKWSAKQGLDDDALRSAVDEMERGLIDADLGGHVMKKRLAKELLGYSNKNLDRAITYGELIEIANDG